jgi:hypothetical protein
MVEQYHRDLMGQPEIAWRHGVTHQCVSRNISRANERILAVAPQGKWCDCADGCGRRLWSPHFGVRHCEFCRDALARHDHPRQGVLHGASLSPDLGFSRPGVSGGQT